LAWNPDVVLALDPQFYRSAPTDPLWSSITMVIEIVDAEEKINAFLAVLDTMMPSGLVTLEKVKELQYSNGKPKA
jgi:PII-like signaling protein